MNTDIWAHNHMHKFHIVYLTDRFWICLFTCLLIWFVIDFRSWPGSNIPQLPTSSWTHQPREIKSQSSDNVNLTRTNASSLSVHCYGPTILNKFGTTLQHLYWLYANNKIGKHDYWLIIHKQYIVEVFVVN